MGKSLGHIFRFREWRLRFDGRGVEESINLSEVLWKLLVMSRRCFPFGITTSHFSYTGGHQRSEVLHFIR